MIYVIKKDGTKEKWDGSKIKKAVAKASYRVNSSLSEELLDAVVSATKSMITTNTINTTDLHTKVIASLRGIDSLIADSYQNYRDYKNTYAKEFENLKENAEDTIYLGDKENANFDSSLISTKGSIVKGYLTKSLYKQFYLSKEEKELVKRGDIYIHDLRDMIFGSINCCLFDMATVLKNGFEMSNVHYTEPKSVLTALQVIGDITLVASAQQFGGFTIPEIDKILLPYCKKTWNNAYNYAIKNFPYCEYEHAASYADNILERELQQGFQSLELKLNTVPSSRGDFAFTTLTFGQWNLDTPKEDKEYLAEIGSIILQTRMKGHGDKQVVFPKLVYLYDKNQIEQDPISNELFNEAIQCSAKCMYPDYLSLTGNIEYNKVAQIYAEDGTITSPMGCRAYLSQWKDPETGKNVTIGRCNIGAVSLNLPVIMAVCKQEYKDRWKSYFYNALANRMEVIRNFLKKRYEIIKNTKASTNPMAFTQGGFYKGNLKPNEPIGDLVKYMTASFGITALNEASILWSGMSLHEDSTFAKQVLNFINNKIDKFKKEDGYLYALYGTPAESLCMTQAKQYKDLTGDTQFGEYFTNSFHLNVKEDVNPFQKQDEELELFHLVNGGHIQYVRLDNPENFEATKTLITRGMDLGFYQGVNFDSAYCNDCHTHSSNVLWTCPHCGSSNLTVISRVCGYLGYSNINGESRMNEGKMAEIKDRVSM